MVNCPKCKARMEQVVYEGIEVDRCTGCMGIWFDSREHEKLRDVPGSEQIDTGDATVGKKYNAVDDIACPRCTSKLVRMVDAGQPHIWYESCAVCGGVFFDAGEYRDWKEYTVLDWLKSIFAPPRK